MSNTYKPLRDRITNYAVEQYVMKDMGLPTDPWISFREVKFPEMINSELRLSSIMSDKEDYVFEFFGKTDKELINTKIKLGREIVNEVLHLLLDKQRKLDQD